MFYLSGQEGHLGLCANLSGSLNFYPHLSVTEQRLGQSSVRMHSATLKWWTVGCGWPVSEGSLPSMNGVSGLCPFGPEMVVMSLKLRRVLSLS